MTSAPRVARALVIALITVVVLPAAVLAAPPDRSPAVLSDLPLGPGDACSFAVVLSNPAYKAHDTAYAPHKDGSQRFGEVGVLVSRATNPLSGAAIERKGGAASSFVFGADGSLVVDARGLFFAWYLPGDDSDLGPGLWLVRGHAQEIYDADGTFVRATFAGNAIDVCAALAD